jgi:RHS repeat-associated protein
MIDAVRGPRWFDHDARGRLVRERRPDSVVERAMDEVGNIFRRADRTDRRYGPGGRLEASDGTHFEHDEDGNLTLRSAPDGSEWRYRWDGAGMLREVERPDGSRVRFEYDPFARRTRKTVVTRDETGAEQIASDRRFVWDGHTVLHEVQVGDDHEVTTWYWEPGTFTPVAREQAGRLLSVASDHLGTPTERYDETGAPTWQMRLDVLGSPSFDIGSPHDCPWRWPGQYEDQETGLCYNRNRYYEPSSGGYTSPDPIGLDGGMSLHAYVPDPILWTDPMGLAKCSRDDATEVEPRWLHFGPHDKSGGFSIRFGRVFRFDYGRLPSVGKHAQRLARWFRGRILPHYHRRGPGGIGRHRPWESRPNVAWWKIWDRL